MERHDVIAALRELPALKVAPDTTDEEAMNAMRPLGMLDGHLLGLVRFSGLTPWEVHPGGDELLYVIEGAVEVIVLTGDGTHRETVSAGSVFVVPKGLWHRQHARPEAALLFATHAETTATSWAEDPR